MFSRTSRLLSLLFLEFSGFYILFSFQGSLLFLNSNSFILSQLVVFVNNFFIYFLKLFQTPTFIAISDASNFIITLIQCQPLFWKICFFLEFLVSFDVLVSQGEYYNIKAFYKSQLLFSFFSIFLLMGLEMNLFFS